MPSYVGLYPGTDEAQERLDNAEHIQNGTFGAKRVVLYDSSGNAIIPSGSASSLGGGRRTSSSPGTAIQINASSTSCKRVTVQALQSNSDVIAVGGSASNATLGAENGVILNPGGSQTFNIDNVNKVYFDPRQSGDGISYNYEA